MPEDFHKSRKNWSMIKHQILRRYVSLFLGKLGTRHARVYYVDGFAGQGLYDDGSKGSAYLAAEIATDPANKSRRDFLRCINVEEEAETFANLEKALSPFVKTGLVTNLHGTFHSRLPEILRMVEGCPVFFFIDPFGTMGLELDTLKKIGELAGPKEVLARYDDTRVKRLINWGTQNPNLLDERVQKTVAALDRRVSQLTDADAIDEFLRDSSRETREETREALICGYERQVREQAGFKFSIHYPIRNPDTKGHRYYLVHFCSFEDGYTYMANFMALAERTVQRLTPGGDELDLGNSSGQLEMLEINDAVKRHVEEQRVNEIVAALPAILGAALGRHSRCQCRYVYAAIVDKFGWRATRAEWIKALRHAAKQGLIALEGTEDKDSVTDSSR